MIKREVPEDVKLGDHEPEFPDRKPVDGGPVSKIKYNVFQWVGKQWRRVKKKKLKTTIISMLVAIASSTFLGVDLSFLVDPIMEYLNPSNEAIMADIWNSIDFSTTEGIIFSVAVLLAAGLSLAAMYFKHPKLGKVGDELKQLVVVIRSGIAPDSPGGKKLTKAEMEKTLHEALGFAEAGYELITGKEIDLDGDGE